MQSMSGNVENMVVSHVCVQRAAKMRRRTYRAHGRINGTLALPCSVCMSSFAELRVCRHSLHVQPRPHRDHRHRAPGQGRPCR